MAREHGAQAQDQALVAQQPRGKVDRDPEAGLLSVDPRGTGNRLLEHKIAELADTVMLLGGGDEFRCGDRALLGMGPARQRLRTDDSARAEIELGLVSDPHLALVDRAVELAEDRQLPGGVFQRFRIVIFPFEPVVRGFVRGD